MEIARAQMDTLFIPDDDARYWEPRLAKIGRWLIAETNMAARYAPARTRSKGQWNTRPAGALRSAGLPDRIDRSADGSKAAIIDYSPADLTIKGMVDDTAIAAGSVDHGIRRVWRRCAKNSGRVQLLGVERSRGAQGNAA